ALARARGGDGQQVAVLAESNGNFALDGGLGARGAKAHGLCLAVVRLPAKQQVHDLGAQSLPRSLSWLLLGAGRARPGHRHLLRGRWESATVNRSYTSMWAGPAPDYGGTRLIGEDPEGGFSPARPHTPPGK